MVNTFSLSPQSSPIKGEGDMLVIFWVASSGIQPYVLLVRYACSDAVAGGRVGRLPGRQQSTGQTS